MKVLIAAGIYPPEIGGPAAYGERLAEELRNDGDTVTVVTYADSGGQGDGVHRVLRSGKVMNRVRYFRAALDLMRDTEIVYLLDWFAAGFPAALAARIRGVPYVVRVGGDYLWEQRYLESGAAPCTLAEFYARGMHKRFSYLPFRLMILFVLRSARYVVFNSDNQRELYARYWGLQRTSAIYNPVPKVEREARGSASREFVFWGRFIVMKNLETLVRAFAKARTSSEYTLSLMGEGPQKERIARLVQELGLGTRVHLLPAMPQREAWKRVRNARAFLLFSWTDIAPNQVYEAMALGLPSLVTKENYLPIRDKLPQMVDPGSVEDCARKIEMLADDGMYALYAEAFQGIRFEQSWESVVSAHRALFSRIV